MKGRLRLVAVALGVVVYGTLGWIAGLVVLGVALVFLARRALRARRALAPMIPCPWCREGVGQYGAFTCGNCRGRSLGWAWRCRICSAWAGHIECPSCGMSVRNPLLGSS